MNRQGIRISDGKKILTVRLADILEEIREGACLRWAVLFLEGTVQPKEGKRLLGFMDKIAQSTAGLPIEWNALFELSGKFNQMFEMVLLGDRNPERLHRYESEEAMIRACEVVVILVDCVFWEVYSWDSSIIESLKKKFSETESLII